MSITISLSLLPTHQLWCPNAFFFTLTSAAIIVYSLTYERLLVFLFLHKVSYTNCQINIYKKELIQSRFQNNDGRSHVSFCVRTLNVRRFPKTKHKIQLVCFARAFLFQNFLEVSSSADVLRHS